MSTPSPQTQALRRNRHLASAALHYAYAELDVAKTRGFLPRAEFDLYLTKIEAAKLELERCERAIHADIDQRRRADPLAAKEAGLPRREATPRLSSSGEGV